MSYRPSSKKKYTLPEPGELNITPVMSLFMMIIPFLLASATFVHLGVVDATLPIISDKKTKSDTAKKRILLSLRINYSGFNLTGEITKNENLEKEGSIQDNLLSKGIIIGNKPDGSYNFEELTGALIRVKEKYGDEDTIFLMPESYVKYDIIIKTMDAARVGISKEGDKILLFQNAVIAASNVNGEN